MSSNVRPNTLRNIMDMRAHLGSFAAARHERDVWVMNVIPEDQQHHLKIVYDRGLIGSVHDWSVISLCRPHCLSLHTSPNLSLSLHLSPLSLSLSVANISRVLSFCIFSTLRVCREPLSLHLSVSHLQTLTLHFLRMRS